MPDEHEKSADAVLVAPKWFKEKPNIEEQRMVLNYGGYVPLIAVAGR